MKTIIENESKISKYLLTDESTILQLPNQISVVVKNGLNVEDVFTIADMNENNSTVFSNISAPENWTGNKYIYDNNQFILNPNWVEPEVVE
jgi:hypothetical protein